MSVCVSHSRQDDCSLEKMSLHIVKKRKYEMLSRYKYYCPTMLLPMPFLMTSLKTDPKKQEMWRRHLGFLREAHLECACKRKAFERRATIRQTSSKWKTVERRAICQTSCDGQIVEWQAVCEIARDRQVVQRTANSPAVRRRWLRNSTVGRNLW